QQGFAFRNIEHSACAPLLKDGDAFSSKNYRQSCRASHKIVLPALDKYETLMIAAQWTHYAGFSEAFKSEVVSTVESLSAAGKKVILIG
ncbi:SGNH hydrolase domain-containing protein, partial [Rhizobiaceae sp. 2RAB30]